jgi:hypothetical protein
MSASFIFPPAPVCLTAVERRCAVHSKLLNSYAGKAQDRAEFKGLRLK